MTAQNHEQRRIYSERALILLAFVALLFGLKYTAHVTMPLAFALFLAALLWPLQRRLQQHMHRVFAVLISFAVFAAFVASMGLALWYCYDQVAAKAPKYQDDYVAVRAQVEEFANQYGLGIAGESSGAASGSSPVVRVVRETISGLGTFVLVVALMILALIEIGAFRQKIASLKPEDKLPLAAHRLSREFARYFAVRTGIGLAQAVTIWIGAKAIGLEFAFIWALSSFVLNYVPTIGSIIAVGPPVAFALFSLGWGDALLVLIVFGGLQLLMGNLLDPLIQGYYLSLSPLVVLLSVMLWGWVWGIPGAFIAIPITISIVVFCAQFDGTRWIAVMLSSAESRETRQPAQSHRLQEKEA